MSLFFNTYSTSTMTVRRWQLLGLELYFHRTKNVFFSFFWISGVFIACHVQFFGFLIFMVFYALMLMVGTSVEAFSKSKMKSWNVILNFLVFFLFFAQHFRAWVEIKFYVFLWWIDTWWEWNENVNTPRRVPTKLLEIFV